jgi:ABC-type bacteriocin/lantibiotic exporter with double-glycine peptidase domain
MVTRKPKADEVQRVLDAFSEDEVKQIRKENPFRNERNDKIRELVNRGVKVSIVAQISGFSPNMISRIRRRVFKNLD